MPDRPLLYHRVEADCAEVGGREGNAVNQGRVYSDLELEYHITREERKGLRSRLLGGRP